MNEVGVLWNSNCYSPAIVVASMDGSLVKHKQLLPPCISVFAYLISCLCLKYGFDSLLSPSLTSPLVNLFRKRRIIKCDLVINLPRTKYWRLDRTRFQTKSTQKEKKISNQMGIARL